MKLKVKCLVKPKNRETFFMNKSREHILNQTANSTVHMDIPALLGKQKSQEKNLHDNTTVAGHPLQGFYPLDILSTLDKQE